MLARYGSTKEVFTLDLIDGMELIKKAREKTKEDEAFALYCAIYPYTDIGFDEFRKPAEPEKKKTGDEILKEVQEALEANRW